MPRSRLGSLRHRCGLSSCWLLTYFAARSAWLVATSTCSEHSLASYLLGRAVRLARGAIDVRHAVIGYSLTLPRSQCDSWRHRRALSSRWPRLTLHRIQLGSLRHRRAACSRWLLTYFASRSAWLVAPLMWIEQSLAIYLPCRAVSLARGAFGMQ